MNFEKVVDGFTRYLSDKIYPTMVGWQRLIAADVVSRAINYADSFISDQQTSNIIRALGYIDREGNVDIENIFVGLKTYIRDNGGRWEIKLPFMPELTFVEQDVDDLLEYIKAV